VSNCEERAFCGSSKCSSKTQRFHAKLLKVLATMELLHCAVLLAVLVNANGEVSVTVGEASVEVREGESAELTCSTGGVDIVFCTFMSPYGENLIMSPDLGYEGGRITFAGTDRVKHCGIKINAIEEKDNGEWKCTITANQDGSAKKGSGSASVTVVKPPASVVLDVASPLVLTYPQESTKEVRCVAEGGRPAPSFAWKLDDEDFAGEVKDVENGQTLTYKSQPEHNGKTLSCVVNHKGYSEEALAAGSNKASVALDVRFKPVAATQPTNLYGMKIGEPFNVLMSFKSHPAPTEFHWKMQDGSEVPMGGSIKRFTAAMLEDGPHAGHFTAKLTINEVTKEDVESKNVLVVQNDLGETQYEFSLGVGQRPPVEAGSGPVIAIVIVALIIVIVIVVAVVARAQGILCFADPPKEEDKEKAVEKEEGSDTESAEAADGAKDDVEAGAGGELAKNKEKVDEVDAVNNNTKKSVTARFSGLLTAMKKSVNGKKSEKYAETESEVKLQESEEEKKEEGEGAEKKDDSIVYADLDKSAMSEGKRPSVSVENEKSEYAEISPSNKE